ncbi:MAG: ATP-binding cassette domain-containing protein [Acetobacteraceae bacterium]
MQQFDSVTVLRDIDLTVHASEVVCLIGPSGSGKSTLLRCINFLEPYDDGEIRIEGRLIGYEEDAARRRRRMSGRRLREMRRETGMVFQQFNLWPHTPALQNVAEPLLRARRLDRADAARHARSSKPIASGTISKPLHSPAGRRR